jgi:hypothetical protein
MLVMQSPLSRIDGWATPTHDRCVRVLLPRISSSILCITVLSLHCSRREELVGALTPQSYVEADVYGSRSRPYPVKRLGHPNT